MKQKGFTLVELLAVIVVLAIIALISVPILLNVIDKAKKGAIKDSVYGLEEAANLYYAQNYTTEISGLYNIKEDNIKYKGSVDKGLVYYGDNGLTTILIYDGKYCGYKYQNSEPEVGNVINNKCIINDKEIEESELTKVDSDGSYVAGGMNGTEPVISGNLIPIIIENDGTVKKADTSSKWYNYYEKKWANAVILNSGDYKVGDTIPESAIRAYFVWIPKYKYQLWNVDVTGTTELAHSIDIIFDTTNTTDTSTSCATPMTSGGTGNCSNGKYMTHPAFISMDVNGFWVGKYELTGSIDNLTVKPNSVSLKSQTVASFFSAMYNFNRDLDSHMMKNTEWGAVAYLSHSKFGIDKEININNNSAYKTGYSAKLTTQQGTYPGEYGDGGNYNIAYNTTIGYLASTTGNISGIYDMAGGAHEYMASYRSGASVPSGDAKYFDVYNGASAANTYNYRILGDATGEMGPIINYKDGDGNARYHNKWYGDYSYFVDSTYPWFRRGGHYDYGVLAGQFHFNRYTGAAYGDIGSRLVLAAK